MMWWEYLPAIVILSAAIIVNSISITRLSRQVADLKAELRSREGDHR